MWHMKKLTLKIQKQIKRMQKIPPALRLRGMRPCLSVKKYSRFAGESPENLWEYLTGRKGQSKIIRTSNYLKFKEKYLPAERGRAR